MDTTVLLGSVKQESNTFSSAVTERPSFQERWEYFNDDVTQLAGTNTEVGGVIEFAEGNNFELIHSIAASATPGGPVAEKTYEFYCERILEKARNFQDQIDGVILLLHGAMVVENIANGDDDDGEGPLISAVRSILGPDIPIVTTYDLHGNVSNQMIQQADALISYETYPHIDMAETAKTGMRVLLDIINDKLHPTIAIERPPMLTAGVSENTSDQPMKGIMAEARKFENREDIIKVNVMPGFFRSDIPSATFSVSVISNDDPVAAQNIAREMAQLIWNRRNEFTVDAPDPTAGIKEAHNKVANSENNKRPIVVADYGDNPGGGGTNDETAVLREMIEQGLSNAGFAFIYDPEVVETCLDAGIGECVTVTIGGKSVDSWTDPIENVTGYIKTISDGVFKNEGPMRNGVTNHLGKTVLLQCGSNKGVNVIVAEKRLQPLDPGIWRHVGIQPEQVDIIAVKSSNHYRAAYEPIANEIIPIDSPGLNVMNPERYPGYSRISRPMFPLDPEQEINYPDWDC